MLFIWHASDRAPPRIALHFEDRKRRFRLGENRGDFGGKPNRGRYIGVDFYSRMLDALIDFDAMQFDLSLDIKHLHLYMHVYVV